MVLVKGMAAERITGFQKRSEGSVLRSELKRPFNRVSIAFADRKDEVVLERFRIEDADDAGIDLFAERDDVVEGGEGHKTCIVREAMGKRKSSPPSWLSAMLDPYEILHRLRHAS